MNGRKPKKDNNQDERALVPKIETPEYQKMYSYYEGLGAERSLMKVADFFGKSKNGIGLISRAFNWRDRIARFENIPKDPVVLEVIEKIDESRKNLVEVVHEVVDTLHELMKISKAIKRSETPSMELIKKQGTLNLALKVWGFEWRNPRDLASLISTLKEVKNFNADDHSKNLMGLKAQQFNIEKMDLVIRED